MGGRINERGRGRCGSGLARIRIWASSSIAIAFGVVACRLVLVVAGASIQALRQKREVVGTDGFLVLSIEAAGGPLLSPFSMAMVAAIDLRKQDQRRDGERRLSRRFRPRRAFSSVVISLVLPGGGPVCKGFEEGQRIDLVADGRLKKASFTEEDSSVNGPMSLCHGVRLVQFWRGGSEPKNIPK